MLETRDIVGARLLLERAVRDEDPRAMFMLAETYDPNQMERWAVRGLKPDPLRAAALYRRAAELGHAEAAERAKALP